MRTNISIHISAGACIIFALMLLVLPLQWVLAAAAAACFHELCHIVAIWLCSGSVSSVALGSRGAEIRVFPISAGREFLCALAGPIGGLMLLLFSKWIPRIAVCAAFQSLYNLLPVFPLDGGRALRCCAERLFPEKAHSICAVLEFGCLASATIFAVYACFWLRLGIVPLLFAAALWLKTKNTPCKPPLLKVQ